MKNKKIWYKKTLELLIKTPWEFFSIIKEISLLKIPFSYFVIIGLLISYALQKIDRIMTMYLLWTNPIFLLILVLIFSLIWFAIHTSFYNFRVNKCWWKSETKQSQKLVLYSNIFLHLFSTIYFIYIAYFFIGDFEDINDNLIDLIDNIYVIIYIILALHAIYISYNWIKYLYPDLNKNKAKFWFIYLPWFFTILSWGIVLFFT